ncbi:MAG: DHA2 family efflux MFS transporter permease subunit [Streptosporangiales bacterium]|nr:DHA2 family efflux MFS transporter permease subunit [Streptosporangiales bacterium]
MTASALPAGVRLGQPAGRWVVLATVLGSGVAMLDATVVNVALPALGEELDASIAGLQWTVNAYTLTLACFILLGGALGDRFGRRRVFVVGVVWFAVASALCGLAQDVAMLVAARALQGIGGALLTPGSLAIIQASFHPDDRARAVGAWSGLGGVAAAIGPFLGGWLVATAGWRWVFLINIPLAAVVVVVALRHVPETIDDEAHGRFDVLGAALAALALAGITYALTEMPGGRIDAPVIAAGAVGVVAAVVFGYVERVRSGGRGPRPMLPLETFRSRQFTAVNAITLVVYGGMSVMFFLLVLHLQVVAEFSPLAAGTALLPVTAIMLVFSARAGALAQRIGPRIPMTVGLVVAAGGMLLVTRIGPGASYVLDVLPAVAVFGLGLSATVAPLTATVLATADPRHAGVASGINNAVARAAGLLAVAAVPPAVGLTGDALSRAGVFATGFRTAMVVSAILLLAGAVASLLTIHDDVLRVCPRESWPQARSQCGVGAPTLEPDRHPAGVAS